MDQDKTGHLHRAFMVGDHHCQEIAIRVPGMRGISHVPLHTVHGRIHCGSECRPLAPSPMIRTLSTMVRTRLRRNRSQEGATGDNKGKGTPSHNSTSPGLAWRAGAHVHEVDAFFISQFA
jgi:hypothetical protein